MHKANDNSSEADKAAKEAQKSEKYKTIQRDCFAVTAALYFLILAVLKYKAIFPTLISFVAQIQANYVLYGAVGVVVLLVLGFFLYNQKEIDKRGKKPGYKKAVYYVNTAFMVILGAVTGFYEYVPYLTYPACLIVLLVAYQVIKTNVKGKYTI